MLFGYPIELYEAVLVRVPLNYGICAIGRSVADYDPTLRPNSLRYDGLNGLAYEFFLVVGSRQKNVLASEFG